MQGTMLTTIWIPSEVPQLTITCCPAKGAKKSLKAKCSGYQTQSHKELTQKILPWIIGLLRRPGGLEFLVATIQVTYLEHDLYS